MLKCGFDTVCSTVILYRLWLSSDFHIQTNFHITYSTLYNQLDAIQLLRKHAYLFVCLFVLNYSQSYSRTTCATRPKFRSNRLSERQLVNITHRQLFGYSLLLTNSEIDCDIIMPPRLKDRACSMARILT